MTLTPVMDTGGRGDESVQARAVQRVSVGCVWECVQRVRLIEAVRVKMIPSGGEM